MHPKLNHPPKLFRSQITRGVKLAAGKETVNRDAGDKGAGIIRGMALLSVGEAAGHGLWCDREMLAQCAELVNAAGTQGIKARFTHPDLSGDGLGKFTGRVKGAKLDGDVVRGDLHFSQAAHDTPDGDLAGYLLTLAADDPQAFGNSIAFECDREAEAQFLLAHGAQFDGNYLDTSGFVSPDKNNQQNLRHARIKTLYAVDAVDDPAANPSGLFSSRRDSLAREAEGLLAFSLGLQSERPALVALDCDPDRAAGFVRRFLANRKLSLVNEKGETMPLTTAEIDADLAKQLSASISPETAAKLAKKTPGKITEKEDGEESGEDDEEDAVAGKKLAAPAKKCKADDEEDDEEMEDDEEDDTGLSAESTATQLATPPGSPTGDVGKTAKPKKKDQATTAAPGDQGAVQDSYQETQDEESEGGVKSAEDATPVGSPGKDKKKGKGPLGDASSNVGYSRIQAVAEAKQFSDAFGPQGAVWFAEGKTFAAAQQLHLAAVTAENARLKAENAALAAKNAKRRGLTEALNAGGETSSVNPEQQKAAILLGSNSLARFHAGLSDQLLKARGVSPSAN